MALTAELLLNALLGSTTPLKHKGLASTRTAQFQRIKLSTQISSIAKSMQQMLDTRIITHEEKERTRPKRGLVHQHKTTRLRVAYQGIPGAYSQVAAKLACLDCTTISCKFILDAVEAVMTGQADRLIVPVENTMEGEKVRNYNLLLEHGLYITQEINLFVNYCLVANPGVKKEDVKKVISHPVALAHCGQGLARLGLDAPQEAVDDTAGAVELLLSQNMLDTAAIASTQAAKLYGLKVLAQGVQNEPWNVTRFLILSKNLDTVSRIEGTRKTSMVIAHQGGLQPLFRVLSAFSSRSINLTKLEIKNSMRKPIKISDPKEGGTVKEFQHAFFVDLEGSIDDQKVLDALMEISVFSPFIRVMGCYAADTKIYDL
ncbi:Arogenate dehydratase/prephenate dehydratase 6 [Nymphaea thermarum]|nr:Arogenate dehydratase/prephenate dehydratase 6 [Nymphaea thermarum]